MVDARTLRHGFEGGEVLPVDWWYAIRVDGRAWSTWTKHGARPWDPDIRDTLNYAAQHVADQIDGCQLVYQQSDELSFIIAPAVEQHWFGGKSVKIASVVASEVTARFNHAYNHDRPATFDARTIPLGGGAGSSVVGYLRWRQFDALRNGISLIASQYRSTKQLHGLNRHTRLDIIAAEGDSLDNYRPDVYGSTTVKVGYTTDVEWVDRHGDSHIAENVTRHRWVTGPAPIFADELDFTDIRDAAAYLARAANPANLTV